MQLIFQPLRALWSDRSGKDPWKIVPIDKNLPDTLIIPNRSIHIIKKRWLYAEGTLANTNYGDRFVADKIGFLTNPYVEALCGALAYFTPNQRAFSQREFSWFTWMDHQKLLSKDKAYLADLRKIYDGDIQTIKQYISGTLNQSATLRDLAFALESNKNIEVKLPTSEILVPARDWWSAFTFGSLLDLNYDDIVELLLLPNISRDQNTEIPSLAEFKADPYKITIFRKQRGFDEDYADWVYWIDWVLRTINKTCYLTRVKLAIQYKLADYYWSEKSLLAPVQDIKLDVSSKTPYFEALSDKPPYSWDYSEGLFNSAIEDLISEGTVKWIEVSQDNLTLKTKVSENARSSECLAFSSSYDCESTISRYLVNHNIPVLSQELQKKAFDFSVDSLTKSGKTPNVKQREALEKVFANPVCLISGLPGTGKTTIMKGLVDAFKMLNRSLLIVAPTGIAAKNIQLATGHDAGTIHRTFGGSKTGNWKHSRETNSQLSYDVLIVEEASMISSELMLATLNGVSNKTQIVIIGDYEQLQSVQPGKVFESLVKSGLPHVHLDEIQRQALNSGIIRLAHAISKRNNQPLSLPSFEPEVIFYESMDDNHSLRIFDNQIAPEVAKLEGLLSVFHKNKIDCLQVIAPLNIDKLGTSHLNFVLKDTFNPDDGKRRKFGYNTFQIDDRIVVTENTSELDLYNGDIGIINTLSAVPNSTTLLFPDSPKPIRVSDEFMASRVSHAYALTVHKSQGSEFDYVVLMIRHKDFKYAYKNLIYTACTRAKKKLYIVGNRQNFETYLTRGEGVKRYSALRMLLISEFGKLKEQKEVKTGNNAI